MQKCAKILLEEQIELQGARKLMSETLFATLFCLKKVFSYIRMEDEKEFQKHMHYITDPIKVLQETTLPLA